MRQIEAAIIFAATFLAALPALASYEFARDYDKVPPCTRIDSRARDVDWRDKGAVTPVQSQGQNCCLSDWAFSVAGAVEGYGQIHTGTLHSLSPQYLMDCGEDPAHCNENAPVKGFELALRTGMPNSSSYPYTGRREECRAPITPAVDITGYCRTVGEAGLVAALDLGPVSVVVRDNGWMNHYTSGIVTAADCTGGDDDVWQAVLIVGYTSNYYIVKNSFGTAWGMSGYFYLARGTNACGVGDFAIIPN